MKAKTIKVSKQWLNGSRVIIWEALEEMQRYLPVSKYEHIKDLMNVHKDLSQLLNK